MIAAAAPVASLCANPLLIREDLQRAIAALCLPVEPHRSPGGARIRLHGPGATYTATAQEMEGFARLLWGIAPLLAGGGTYDRLDHVRDGLISGCDPTHPEYWGVAADRDQRLVEYAAIAYALLISPEAFWHPLSATQRAAVATFLGIINQREVYDNNWRFFRVLVNLALAQRDAPFSRRQLRVDLDRLDTFYRGDGWHVDGCNRAVDYYNAFGMHFYGLLCASALHDLDPSRAGLLIERAEAFAREFIHWFSRSGAAIPYGRSLIYRSAQGAFWSALACARSDAVPVGVVKGLVLRHLRWWCRQPILSGEGLLTMGYAYPNQLVADRYSSPCSPYWALKAFVPVALPAESPFWQAAEQDLPASAPVIVQRHPGMLVCRDGAHVFALAGAARVPPRVRHGAAKYAKFCYSTEFGFSVPCASETLQSGAHDSALAFTEPGDDRYRARACSDAVDISCARLVSHWRAGPDVRVTTWLVPIPPWHVRLHRVRTTTQVAAAEGGFSIGLGSEEATWHEWQVDASIVSACARSGEGVSIILNLHGARRGEIIRADPNTNVLWPRTVIPTLHATLPPGEHWLACAVAAGSGETADRLAREWPSFTLRAPERTFDIHDTRGRLVLTESMTD